MRTLVAMAVLVASCVALPPSASPSADVATPNPSALRATLEARFAALAPGPPYPGSIWSSDQPVTLEPRAFGTFPADRQPGAFLTVDHVRLATAFPSAPTEASVALVGSYAESWKETVTRTVADPSVWDVVPLYAEVSSHTSLGPMPPLSSAGLDAARALLQRNGLLLPDMEPHPHPGAGRFEFIRRLDGLPIFTNNGVSLIGITDGSAQALARRRPILAVSRYPLRSPADAWSLLQQGQGRTMYVDDGAPLGPEHSFGVRRRQHRTRLSRTAGPGTARTHAAVLRVPRAWRERLVHPGAGVLAHRAITVRIRPSPGPPSCLKNDHRRLRRSHCSTSAARDLPRLV